MAMPSPSRNAFIVGSPRSGTTILGEILGRHRDVVQWYEPYFIWDYYIGNLETDVRNQQHLTGKHCHFIRREFARYLEKSGAKILVEKTPENSFRIPFIHAVFPKAKWIHLIRDGRAVTSSIHLEWLKRKEIVENRNFKAFWHVAAEMMSLQPFWRNRLQALWFEIKYVPTLDPRMFFNKSKWRGHVGWGPRYPGWRKEIKNYTILQFNARQWLKSVEAVFENVVLVGNDNFIEVRYEDLVCEPDAQFVKIFDFLDLAPCENSIWSDLETGNIDKWKRTFKREEIEEFGPIIDPMLRNLGYIY